jgi:subtilase family serine protease
LFSKFMRSEGEYLLSRMRVFLSLLLLLSLSFTGISQVPEVVGPASLYVNVNGGNKIAAFTPAQVRHAYGVDDIANQGEGQTIGIVIPLHNPTIKSDVDIFSDSFGLPRCTPASCDWLETRFYPEGVVPVPDAACSLSCLQLFQLESALDVEWAHAIAPKARIVLVETSRYVADLLDAGDVAIASGASVISMSWAVPENGRSKADRLALNSRFIKPHVAFVAAAGDTGNYSCLGVASLCWPATSSYVTGVGGTTLQLNSQGDYSTENAWKGGGGGFSLYEGVPDHQKPFNPYTNRGVPDVAYHANPQTGFVVYDSNPYLGSTGWQEVGGTSAGAPQWAALMAIANSIRKAAAPSKAPLTGSNPYLYSIATGAAYASNYHDIFAGNNTNGQCGPLCSASKGYDFVTGLGSPNAANLINALASLP